MDPDRAAQDLMSLSNLLQRTDPSDANNYSQEASNIEDSILHGLIPPPSSPPNIPPVNIGGLNGHVLTPSVPSLTPLSFNLNSSSTPNITTYVAMIILFVLFSGIFAYTISHNRIRLPSGIFTLTQKLRPLHHYDQPENYRLNSAKDLVIYYFRRTTRLMAQRGVPKQYFETHREFSGKCVTRVEAQPVTCISQLYEKAMFSGREVNFDDAHNAQENTNMIESIQPSISKKS
jgi:hypothetical protein